MVDDDKNSRDITRLFLRDICEIDFALTGPESLQMVAKKKYDAIIMDINLGRGMDGLQATKVIREMPEYKNIAILALTAFAMAGDREEFLSMGCTHYLSKPFTREELVNVMKEVLSFNN
jgi:CheY-like chemotaxis protein